MENIESINKEEIASYAFKKEEVLTDSNLRLKRKENLIKAERLGNGYQGKVKIQFLTAEGNTKLVETTVWAYSDDHIILKGGVILPVHAISSVEF